MPEYFAEFSTDTEFAFVELEAESPEAALRDAQEIAANHSETLAFRPYEGRLPIQEIVIELWD